MVITEKCFSVETMKDTVTVIGKYKINLRKRGGECREFA